MCLSMRVNLKILPFMCEIITPTVLISKYFHDLYLKILTESAKSSLMVKYVESWIMIDLGRTCHIMIDEINLIGIYSF